VKSKKARRRSEKTLARQQYLVRTQTKERRVDRRNRISEIVASLLGGAACALFFVGFARGGPAAVVGGFGVDAERSRGKIKREWETGVRG
jgi:hypothetical protein